ncbi:MAG TPA: hypothetical protein VGP08_03400 [Pyrinomonadaceae bacterium]|nr:hypothetical protein [Pyrinomonadaceae bacterium]
MALLTTEGKREFAKTGGLFALWAGLLAGPVVWLLQFQTNYTLVPILCRGGAHNFALHAVFVVALLLVASAGLLAWRNFRAAGDTDEGTDESGVLPRTRFMSLLGLCVTGVFFLVILAQWIASWVFGPCQW